MRGLVLWMLVGAGCASMDIMPSAAGRVAPAAPAELARRSLAGVVLVLNTRADGTVKYGSGLILDRHGLVLTSLHVVEGAERLSGMLYREGRVSYTPMDGGLTRYLFENQRDVHAAELLNADPISDLALLRLQTDTSSITPLPLASEPVRVGDTVISLGHPQETVWSFTQGVVAAIHHGAIQHGATVSFGSSGGPLLDAQGRVVGLNTAKVISEAQGMAFARPISFAARLMPGAQETFALSLRTPEEAASSCWRAQELGRPQLAECFDWSVRWSIFQEALSDVKRQLGLSSAVARALEVEAHASGGAARWIEAEKASIASFLRELEPDELDSETETANPRLRALLAEAGARSSLFAAQVRERNGLKGHICDSKSLRDTVRMGLRTDEVEERSPGLAWVRMTGRNVDGTEYQFTEAWRRYGDRWLQRSPPTREDLALLPAGWPPPIEELGIRREKMRARLLKILARVAPAALPEPKGVQPLSLAPGTRDLMGERTLRSGS